ncbi:hypothetical protein ABOM_007019 [Aspergillus bombycis]|uniref:Uncharacterized protein n=1 Tax=Aspergillus bombycis TaxID=109264 RepID=A0A1F7ZXF6_9EURO|nr:hypothetical protein ABOM_007019 [Aspergillus bombycis]OGM44134.1 hypothetical protein ABOM_007019 [Aspergillus bombycis]
MDKDQPQPDASADFHPDHVTRATFQALLTRYPATVEAVTRRKVTDRVLQASIRGKRGKRVPPAQVQNAELDAEQKKQVEAEVQAYRELDALRYEAHTTTTSAAGEEAEAGAAAFPKTSLDALVKPLRGVGVATASLLLSVGTIRDPEHEAPFYSDDSYLWLCLKTFPGLGQESGQTDSDKVGKKASKFKRNGEINVKYDLAEYRALWTAVNALRARLNETETKTETEPGSSSGKVSCADVEKVAFVLRHLDSSGYLEPDLVDHDSQGVKANPGSKRKRFDEAEKTRGRKSKKQT